MSRIISPQEFSRLVRNANRPANEVGAELQKRGITVEGIEEFRADRQPQRSTFMQRLSDSAKSVPERLSLSFAEPETIELEKEEISKGFDLADLPGDIADVIGPALPMLGLVGGATVGAAFGGLGAIPGAGIGAGVGEAARRSIGELTGVREIDGVEKLKAVGKETVLGSATQATFGLAGKGLQAIGRPLGRTRVVSKTLDYLTEQLPNRVVNSTLKPLSKEFDFGKNPGKAVVDEGIVATSRADLIKKIIGKKSEVGEKLNSVILQASRGAQKKQIDLEPLIVAPIKEAQLQARKRGETELFKALTDLRDGLTMDFVERAGRIVPSGKKNLVVTPFGAWEEKQTIGNGIRWTGQAFNNDLNQIKFKIFSNVKDSLTENVPRSKKLLSRYANLLGAENSALRQVALQDRQNIASFGQTTLGGLTAVGSLATGSAPLEAVGKGVAAGFGLRLLGGTASKTAIAQGLKGLPTGAKNVVRQMDRLAPAEKIALRQFLFSSPPEE